MRNVVERLAEEGVFCRRLEHLEPRELGSRKKIGIFYGVATDDYYCLIFVLRKKSRILNREAKELTELHHRLMERKQLNIRRLYLLLDTSICSKAADLLQTNGWKILPLPGKVKV